MLVLHFCHAAAMVVCKTRSKTLALTTADLTEHFDMHIGSVWHVSG